MSTANLNTAIDLADLFKKTYGYTPAYVAGLPAASEKAPAAIVPSYVKKTTNIFGQSLYGQSDLIGREVFCPITIKWGVGNKLKTLNLPYSVIGFSRTKTIISTEMTELNGSVDEIISNNDYEISIKGFLIGQYEQFPDDQLNALHELFKYNGAVELHSAISDLFEVDQILLQQLEVPQKPAVIGVRDFSIKAKSSSIFTLYQL